MKIITAKLISLFIASVLASTSFPLTTHFGEVSANQKNDSNENLTSNTISTLEEMKEEETDEEEFIDINVRYEEKIPDISELDESYQILYTSKFLPVQSMRVKRDDVMDIMQRKDVVRITEDQIVETSQSDYTPIEANDWNLDAVETFTAWEEGITGQGVQIAILDTGFDTEHPDLNFAGGYSIFGEEHELGSDDWTNDHTGHGTHVAGIIGSQPFSEQAGIAYNAELYGVKIYHESQGSQTSASNLMEGLEWAIDEGVDLINISSGYNTFNQEHADLIEYAYDQGILIFCANGNTQNSASIQFPAAYGQTIAVANVFLNEDNQWDRVHDSLTGPETELAAPGLNIASTWLNGSYEFKSGTSQATPHVTGVAALLMQQNPGLSHVAIRQLLQENALDLAQEGRDQTTGYGLVRYTESESDEPDEPEEPEEPEEDEEPEEPEEPDEPEEPEEEPEEPGENNDGDSGQDGDPDNNNGSTDDDSDSNDDEDHDSNGDNEENTSSSVWIRPSIDEDVARINPGDLASVADGGTLVLSFDFTLSDISSVRLTEEEIEEIRERNITLLIARPDIEWSIPSENFLLGEAILSFEVNTNENEYTETVQSEIFYFSLTQNGEEQDEFPNEMSYSFRTDNHPEESSFIIYEWIESNNEWIELTSTYRNDLVSVATFHTGTLAVFHPEAFEVSESGENSSQDIPDDEEPITDDEDHMSNEDTEQSNIRMYILIGSTILLLLFIGIYIYMKRKRDTK